MPPVIEAHFFAPDDVNGDTIFECSTDDAFVKGIKLDIQRDKLGSGQITFARRVPTTPGLFTPQVVQPEVFVRYLIPSIDSTHYLWGNFIGPRQQKVISKAESGGEGFTFGGPGPKFYLTRMILWSASFSGQDNAVDRDAGLWTWPETAKLGRIFGRLLEEEQDNPHGPFLPDLTKSFGDVNDSNGDPWVDDVAGTEDFTLNIQDDYLKILWALENESDLVSNMNLGTVSNPLMQLGLYQSFGRDLTGDPGDPDAVHFIEGQRIVQGPGNIASDLDVEGESLKKGTHALVRGADGIYHFVASPDFVPGEYKKVVPVDYSSSANTSTLDRAGKRYLRRQRGQERGIKLKIVTGVTPEDGLYVPGFEGTDGHFWLSDTVSLTTGIDPNQTELDYDAEDQLVTGIQIELAKAVRSDDATTAARSLAVTVELNQDRTSDATTPEKQGTSSAGGKNCNCIRLCAPAHEGTDVLTRLYFSGDGSILNLASAPDAAWENDEVSATKILKTTADGTHPGGHNIADSLAADAGGNNVLKWQGTYGPLSADMAAAIAAGGIQVIGHIRTRMRSGAGISESSQHGISQMGIRVTTGATTTIRGTALALNTLALGSGATEWRADTTHQNRVFPAGPANDILDPVAGAAAGDYLVVEIGVRNFTSGTATGSGIALTNIAASDLPEDETTTTQLNSWIDLFEAGSGAITGDVPEDTVRQGEGAPGTSGRASRCDHKHEHGLLSPDGLHYHSREDIEGSEDLTVDELTDVDTTGVTDGQILKWDATEGLWVAADDEVGSVNDLDDLSDVNISSPASGQALTYSGSEWTNSTPGVPDGVVGPILIQDTPAGSPLVFADLLQNDDGDDLLYADV